MSDETPPSGAHQRSYARFWRFDSDAGKFVAFAGKIANPALRFFSRASPAG